MSVKAAALRAAAIRPALPSLRGRRGRNAAERRPHPGSPRRRRLGAAITAAALVAIVAVAVVALTSGGSATEAQLGQDRAHLALVAKALYRIEGDVKRETSAAKVAWPYVKDGLPAKMSVRLLSSLTEASAAANALPSPSFLEFIHELTGPGARIARLYRSFLLLSSRGWGHTLAAAVEIAHGGRAASFDRETSGLYIDSAYNGSFYLSLIGEKVLASYERLGEEAEFGSALTQAEVKSLAAAFSPEAVELTPHEWTKLQVQR